MAESSSDPDRIERDLDQTRARLDSRLSELQERLSPGQVVDDLMSYFRGSGGAEFGHNLLDSVRANPLPAALAGIGIAWLMASNPRPPGAATGTTAAAGAGSGRGRVRVVPEQGGFEYGGDSIPTNYDLLSARVRTAEGGVVREAGEAEQSYRERLDAARGQALGLARQAQETAASYAQRVQDALSSAASAASQGIASATQAVSRGAHDLRDRAGDVAAQVGGAVQQAGQQASGHIAQGGQTARQVGGSLVSAITENPVLLGVVGLAAGALLGALVPQSDQEEAALGGVAGQARDAARGLAQEVVDRGGQVVQAAVQAGRESAGQHGLGGATSLAGVAEAARTGDLAGGAAQVARDMLQATDQAIREQALGASQGGSAPSPSNT